ncbi:MAG: KTSC domain-containing protein [Promethearchaeota archaeon]
MVRRRRPKPYMRDESGRFVPSRLLTPTTRKEQPPAIGPMRVGRLVWKDYPMMPVSSTNIAGFEYIKGKTIEAGELKVQFLSGKMAKYYDVPFSIFEEFYYAHSKGTFFYYNIRKGGYRWNYV